MICSQLSSIFTATGNQPMRACKIILVFMISSMASGVSAGVADYFNLYNVPNAALNFGNWAYGDGGQSKTATFCIASSNYNNAYNDPPPAVVPPAVHELYTFKVADRSAPAGFFMYLDNDDTNTGNARIAIQVQHRDRKAGNAWVALIDNTLDGHTHTGQFKGCRNGKNSQLRIIIANAELEQARAGPYRARLRAIGLGGSSGSVADTDNFRADLRVSSIVRVTNLNNVNLGTYTGGGNINAIESFCVYSNNDTAAYGIQVSSPNQDASDNFYLVNGGLSAAVPYTLYFKADLAAGPGSEVQSAILSGNGNNAAVNCGGSDNSKLTITILASDMNLVPADSYSDTLTVLISPQ